VAADGSKSTRSTAAMHPMASSLRFLVVDDLSTMRRIVCNLLLECGYTDVGEADDGAAALTKLRSENFDFVVCDIDMPKVNGLQLLAEAKKDPALMHIPILLVTAEARKEDILLAAQLGAAGYVVKPFSKAILEEKVIYTLKKLGLQ
jgi:two-component system, chemotaxis family, chemotaxis protein CheY